MTWQRVVIPIAIAGLLQSTVALAQFGMGAPGAARPSPRFDAAAQLGEQIADLTIVDAQGEPVSLRELAKYLDQPIMTFSGSEHCNVQVHDGRGPCIHLGTHLFPH